MTAVSFSLFENRGEFKSGKKERKVSPSADTGAEPMLKRKDFRQRLLRSEGRQQEQVFKWMAGLDSESQSLGPETWLCAGHLLLGPGVVEARLPVGAFPFYVEKP